VLVAVSSVALLLCHHVIPRVQTVAPLLDATYRVDNCAVAWAMATGSLNHFLRAGRGIVAPFARRRCNL